MKKIKKLTVYLGSSGRCRDIFKETATAMGTLIGQGGYELVYGGMDTGLMGIVANNTLAAKGRVTGIIPKNLKDSERIHPSLSQTILVPDLWERKLKMFNRADAIIVLPGGFGTIDEALEALYWGHLKSHNKPVVFVNTDHYWDEFLEFISCCTDLRQDLLFVAKSVDEVIPLLKAYENQEPIIDEDDLPNFEGDILSEARTPLIIDEASIKESYILATALGLKQLGKHTRAIGVLDKNGQYAAFMSWVVHAQKEHFITDRCTKLFDYAQSSVLLDEKMAQQEKFTINLDQEKWGPSVTTSHMTIREIE